MIHSHSSQFLAVALLAGIIAVSPPPRRALGVAPPLGSALLRQSLAAMAASLHQVHAVQQFRYAVPRQSPLTGWMRGDCVMNTRSYSLQVRFTASTAGGAAPGTVHVVILTTAPRQTRIWERSRQTGGRWRRDDSDNGVLVFIYLCPAAPFFLAGCVNQQCTAMRHIIPDGLRDLGPVTVRGYRTWHLRTVIGPTVSVVNGPQTHGDAVDDFYLDRTSLFLVRWTYRDRGNIMVTDYSRFNRPVMIRAPTVKSSAA